jgi:hypothetical protein
MRHITKWALSGLLLLGFVPLRADEFSFYFLSNLAVQYEGTGFRQSSEGWELKVKPQDVGSGFRWRRSLPRDWALQTQYWRNNSHYSWEDGNSVSDTLRQTGETRLSVQTLMTDLRRPLADSSASEAVVGLQGVAESFHRKNILFNGRPEAGRPLERLYAAGAYMGFHRGGHRALGRGFLVWDWEATLGHFFVTKNRQNVQGGSIRSNGYSYGFRAEGGYEKGGWRATAGFVRHMFQITVPGGRSLATGAAASLPINKIDFASPFFTLGYVF